MPSGQVRPLASPSTAADDLRRTELLVGASDEAVRALSSVVDWWYLEAGTPLFDVGDEADGLYLVVRGRLESRAGSASAAPRGQVLGEVGRGGMIGESSVVAERRRSSSARAIRDSVVARLAPERFDELAADDPALSRRVARLAAQRLPHEPRPVRGRPQVGVVAVVGLDGTARPHHWARRLAQRLRALAPDVHVVGDDELGDWLATGPDGVARRSAAAEDTYDVVLVPLDLHARSGGDAHLVLHHVDVVVGVGAATQVPTRPALEVLRRADLPVALALVHRDGRRPTTTGRWLDDVGRVNEIRSHTHLAGDADHDLDRLARELRGRSIGLVLGGGGSRGFAHIGAWRALQEAGVTVDRVGGSSMGAIMGAQVAAGWSADEMLDRNVAAWSRGKLLEFGLPTLSLLRGRRARRVLHGLFGHRRMEDLWLDYFCTTVDLSTYRLDVNRRGAVADWVGASATVPGLWPPLVDQEGHLHIDGGMLDNVPTGVMRAGHSGPIIGVDVSHRQSAMVVAPDSTLPAGFGLVRARLRGEWSPTILDVLSRGSLLASLQRLDRAAQYADLYVAPPVEDMGFAAFDRIHELTEIGYRATVEALETADLTLLTPNRRA